MSSAEWTGYRLVQEDVWFFRDGKPSVIGSDHYLRSIFPPFPSTLYGLVRTQRLLEWGVDLHSLGATTWGALDERLRREIGEWGSAGTLVLRGPWLVRDGKILLPAPLDLRLFTERGRQPEDDRVVGSLRLRPIDGGRQLRNWSHELAPMAPHEIAGGQWKLWAGEADPESAAGWFVTVEGMREWIAGGIPACEHFVSGRQLWTIESRTGVGLDSDRRTHAEHQLYTFGFVRLERGVALGFELSEGDLKMGFAARFGGENRVARIEGGPALSGESGLNVPHTAAEGFVTTLLTPALFASGPIPAGRTVVSAVVPGPALAGGWDLAQRRPKALRRAVPAGSVYWIDGASPAPLESWSEQANEGYGLMLAGHRPGRFNG